MPCFVLQLLADASLADLTSGYCYNGQRYYDGLINKMVLTNRVIPEPWEITVNLGNSRNRWKHHSYYVQITRRAHTDTKKPYHGGHIISTLVQGLDENGDVSYEDDQTLQAEDVPIDGILCTLLSWLELFIYRQLSHEAATIDCIQVGTAQEASYELADLSLGPCRMTTYDGRSILTFEAHGAY